MLPVQHIRNTFTWGITLGVLNGINNAHQCYSLLEIAWSHWEGHQCVCSFTIVNWNLHLVAMLYNIDVWIKVTIGLEAVCHLTCERLKVSSMCSSEDVCSLCYMGVRMLKGTLCNILSNLLPKINVFIHK